VKQTKLFQSVSASAAKLVASAAGTASDAIGKLTHGCRIVGLSKGQISILDLIEAVLWQTGPAHVMFSTWTLSDLSIERAEWLVGEGRILSLEMLVDRSFARCKPERARLLVQKLGEKAFMVTRTHAKFALIRNDEWSICIRTSANLNRNPRFEQFDVDDSREIHDFFRAHVDEIRAMCPKWDQTTGRTFAQFEAALGGGMSAEFPDESGGDGRSLRELAEVWRSRL
jgi:hypothetical protein